MPSDTEPADLYHELNICRTALRSVQHLLQHQHSFGDVAEMLCYIERTLRNQLRRLPDDFRDQSAADEEASAEQWKAMRRIYGAE